MRQKDSLILAGSLAQRPFHGGHTWMLLNLARGFARLGWEVTFVDRLEPGMYLDPTGCPTEIPDLNIEYFVRLMQAFGFRRYCLLGPKSEVLAGMEYAELLRVAAESPAAFDVMGFLADEEVRLRVGRRVFFDIDPGFWQMWRENGHGIRFEDHDDFVTIGENVGHPRCSIPTCGISWITSPQPVVLEEWKPASQSDGAFTSVISWRGPFGPIEHRGRTYGLR
ncbi:MAG: hypothetical protein ACREX3_15255, partial [Gammaproteobacteria bacterium]